MLEIRVDGVLNGRILQEVVVVDDWVRLGNRLLILTLPTGQKCRSSALLNAIHHVVTLGTELHCD